MGEEFVCLSVCVFWGGGQECLLSVGKEGRGTFFRSQRQNYSRSNSDRWSMKSVSLQQTVNRKRLVKFVSHWASRASQQHVVLRMWPLCSGGITLPGQDSQASFRQRGKVKSFFLWSNLSLNYGKQPKVCRQLSSNHHLRLFLCVMAVTSPQRTVWEYLGWESS